MLDLLEKFQHLLYQKRGGMPDEKIFQKPLASTLVETMQQFNTNRLQGDMSHSCLPYFLGGNEMDYKEFKEMVKENFLSYLPEEYQNYSIEIVETMKVNRKMDALRVIPNVLSDGYNISPFLYVDHMYEAYKESNDFDKVMEDNAETFVSFMKDEKYRIDIKELDKMNLRDNVIITLINTEQNSEMLSKIPHREFEDLSVIYRWIIKKDNGGFHSNIINNESAARIGITEDELFKIASENTKNMYPPIVKNMEDIIKEIFMEEGMPEEIAANMIASMKEESELDDKGIEMYVITNKYKMFGAAGMLFEDELHNLSQKLGDDLYILPSSLHEVIVVPAKNVDPEVLAEMVHDVNTAELDISERLSNQVYHYDKTERKLHLATDTIYKSLDNMVAQPAVIYETGNIRR